LPEVISFRFRRRCVSVRDADFVGVLMLKAYIKAKPANLYNEECP
jgi:hypothetical protein